MNKKDIKLIRYMALMRGADYKKFNCKYHNRILQYLENKKLTKFSFDDINNDNKLDISELLMLFWVADGAKPARSLI